MAAAREVHADVSASSGRVATPASSLQMFPPPLRHEDNATSVEYGLLRAQCADHRHAVILSPASAVFAYRYLAEGAKSAVFSLRSLKDSSVQFALKFDKAGTWTKSAAVKAVRSIDPFEIDATCLVWFMLSARGLSPHVPRVFGVLPFVFERDAVPYVAEARMSKTDGLVLELLTGFVTPRDVRVLDLKALLREGMAGRIVGTDGRDQFADVLRVVLFQVLYTVAMWGHVTGNCFRHNDLHAMNIGLTYWNQDHTATEAEYHLPGPDGVDRVFVLRTPICATVIDFGYAALLKEAGGPVFDSRFYFYNNKEEKQRREVKGADGLVEPKFHAWGMSHRQPSRHYDTVLLMYAVLHEFNMKKSRHAAANEFRRFYARCFGAIHSAPRHTFQQDMCHGRLTPFGQAELMRNAPVAIGAKTFFVMDPAEALCDPYFIQLRGVAKPRLVVFGLQPSAAAVAPPLPRDAMSRTSSILSRSTMDAAWKPKINRAGILQNFPLPGLWSTLTRTLDEKKASTAPPRKMSPSEISAWLRNTKTEEVLEGPEAVEVHPWNEASAPGENL
jgi:hypothetical protein